MSDFYNTGSTIIPTFWRNVCLVGVQTEGVSNDEAGAANLNVIRNSGTGSLWYG
jgi:hypothetical protein